jgi:hypothetical protein
MKAGDPLPEEGTSAGLRGFLIILLVTALIYSPLLAADFAWDDEILIPFWVERGWNGSDLFGDLWPADTVAINELHYFRPLMAVDLLVSSQIFGDNPGVYHGLSVGLHLAVGALLFGLARALCRELSLPHGDWLATGTAAAFLLHPAHQEAVAFIAARNDLWAALAVLGSALLWLRSRWWLASLVVFGGLLFKESALAAVILLPMMDLSLGRKWLKGLVPLVTVTGVYLGLRSLAVGLSVSNVEESLGLGDGAAYLAHGAALTLFARGPSVHQPLSLVGADPTWWVPGAVGLVAGIILLARSGLGRAGLLLWVVSCGLALPVAFATDNAADRYFYQASLGLCIGGLPLLAALRWTRPRVLVVIIGLVFVSAKNMERLTRWANTEALWTDAAQFDPTGYSYRLLGLNLVAEQRFSEADQAYLGALGALYPDESALGLLGSLRFIGPDPVSGCPYLLESSRRQAPNPGDLGMLATCARLNGDLGHSREYLERGLAQAPAMPQLNLERLALARAVGDKDLEAEAHRGLVAADMGEAAIRDYLSRFGGGAGDASGAQKQQAEEYIDQGISEN